MSVSVLFIASCGSPEPPPKKTVFDPLTQQLDRAREVQKTVDANADATRKAGAYLSLWIFVSLLASALCASYAATIGGRQRDAVVV